MKENFQVSISSLGRASVTGQAELENVLEEVGSYYYGVLGISYGRSSAKWAACRKRACLSRKELR